MRICILSQCRLGFVGGEESYIKMLSSCLSKRNHDVVLISRKLFGVKVTSPQSNQINDNRVLRVPQIIYIIGLLIMSFLVILRAISENKRGRIDVLHAVHDLGYAGLVGVVVSKMLRIPLCVSVLSHRKFLLNRYLKGIFGWFILNFDYFIERLVYFKADVIIVLNDSLKNYVASFDIKPEKLVKIPIAIDTNAFDEFDGTKENNELRHEENEKIIGYVGRLEREKNLFTLLQAFKEIEKRRQDVHLILVGDGSQKSKLKNYTKNANISNVHFLGVRRDIPNLLQILDIFVLPSFTEGMPFSLVEAMAAGKAIIASDIPSIREIVKHGEEAVLVNPYDAEELKQAILLLCEDSNLRSNLGRKAKEKAKLYDVDKVCGQILKVYEQLIRCKPKRAFR